MGFIMVGVPTRIEAYDLPGTSCEKWAGPVKDGPSPIQETDLGG